MRMREPLLVSVVTVLAMATPVVTMSPATAASAKAPTIVGVVPSTAAVRTGAKLAVKIVAENESKSSSASYKLQFLLSKTTSPTGARKIGEGTLSSFAAKTRKTFAFSVSIPSNAAAGSFRLLLCHPRTGQSPQCHQDNVKLTVTLAPAKLTISPTSHNYGDILINEGDGKRFTVRNVGRRWSGAVAVSLSGAQASSFDFLGYSCGPSLAPNATCTIDAVFAPTTAGARHATLKVKPSAKYSTGAIASLSGTGLTPASLSSSGTLHFDEIAVGSSSAEKTVFVFNNGDSPSGTITTSILLASADQFSLSDDQCNGQTIAGHGSCTVKVRFNPTSAGLKGAGFYAEATPGHSTLTSLDGTGVTSAQLELSSIEDFGSIPTHVTSPAQTVTVTNTGGQPSGPIAISITGSDFEDFAYQDDTCGGVTLAGGASCTVKVTFGAISTGPKSATFTAAATPGGPVTAPLTGTSIAPATFTVTPSPYDFGAVEIGTPASKDFTVTNTGGVPTGPMGFHLTGSGWFSGLGTTCPSALAAGASCTITIQFLPTADDANSAQLVVTGAPTPPATVNLSGTGATAPAFSLTPSSLTFDDQAVGTTSVKTLTLNNTGGLPSGNLSIYFNGSGFEIDSATTTCAGQLAGGASCTIGVRFEPDAVWSFGGLVNALAHPPGFSGLASASVSGNGINPPV